MPIEKSNPPKCELCGRSLPENAAVCPNCGANLSLIQMIKAIPPVNSIRKQVSVPAMVSRPEGNPVNAAPKSLPVRKPPTVPLGVLGPAGDEPNDMHRVVLTRKPSSIPARVLKPARDETIGALQGLPNRNQPAAPARVINSEGNQTKVVPQVVAAPIVPPQQAGASVNRRNLVRDQGGIRLPQIEEPSVHNVPLKRLITLAGEAVKSNLKRFFSHSSAASKPATQQKPVSHRFIKDWILPTILVSALFFLLMEYLVKNYQASASGSAYQEPQSTMLALGERISQAESTISAQQDTIFALQSTSAAQQFPLAAQGTVPATQIDLSKTLLLGPLDGELIHSNDGLIKTFWADQDTKNFILSVVLVNPYSGISHPWDTCIRFRRMYTNEYRLTLFSTRKWTLTFGLSTEPIAGGTITNLKTGEAESNAVSLVVRDGIASLKVNDVLLPNIDISAYQDSGDVGIAIGTQKGDEVDGKTTIYHEFTLWNIP